MHASGTITQLAVWGTDPNAHQPSSPSLPPDPLAITIFIKSSTPMPYHPATYSNDGGGRGGDYYICVLLRSTARDAMGRGDAFTGVEWNTGEMKMDGGQK